MVTPKSYNLSMQITSPTPATQRNRRFERASESVAFQLTARDEDIIRAVGRNRFLSSRQIQALFSGSPQKILRRLNGLYHAGYLDRPRAQLDFYATAGSAPLVYGLADKGARHINARDHETLPEHDWKRKNRAAGRPFIEHTLGIAEFHVDIISATRNRPNIELINAHALIAEFPKAPVTHDKAFMWTTTVRHNDKAASRSVNPDYAFALRSAVIGRRCYLVEIDRGTMPLERAEYDQTSIARKIDTYIHGHAAKLHERQFGWKALRVIFVTDTEQRATNMRTIALANLTKNPSLRRLFYFTHAPAIHGKDMLAHTWIDGNGEPQTLI